MWVSKVDRLTGVVLRLKNLAFGRCFSPERTTSLTSRPLKQAVNDLCHLTMQKTAGQKKYAKAVDLSFDDLDGIKWTILIEAVILVLSGKLDGMEDESEDEEDGRS